MRTDNQRDHAGAISSSRLEPLDQLLHLPYLNLRERALSANDRMKDMGCDPSPCSWQSGVYLPRVRLYGDDMVLHLHSSRLR